MPYKDPKDPRKLLRNKRRYRTQDHYEPLPFVKATRDSEAERGKKKSLRDWLEQDAKRGITLDSPLTSAEKQLIRDYVRDGKARQGQWRHRLRGRVSRGS